MFNYRSLDIHPAFGYESYAIWRVAVDQNEKQAKDLAHEHWEPGEDQPTMDPTPLDTSYRKFGGKKSLANNISKLLSYTPILSIIAGIARVTFAGYLYIRDRHRTYNEASPNHYLRLQENEVRLKHIVRGITEIALGVFSLGYLLTIPDLIQTVLYNQAAKKYVSSNPIIL